jgi:hypothetical protein
MTCGVVTAIDCDASLDERIRTVRENIHSCEARIAIDQFMRAALLRPDRLSTPHNGVGRLAFVLRLTQDIERHVEGGP